MPSFKIGLYGCGGRTGQILGKVLAAGIGKVTLCYDIDPAAAERRATEFCGRVCTKEELISSNECDMLLISLFPAAHPSALLDTYSCGKPIYIEKPVAVTIDDARLLMKIVDKAYVHVGLSYHYWPVFRKAAELVVNEGIVGDVVGITINNMGYTDIHNSVFAQKGENANWRARPETGGELTQHMCHAFEFLMRLAGRFESVVAMSTQHPSNTTGIEDVWDIILRHQGACLSSLHESIVRNPKQTQLGYIEGTKGSLEYEWSTPSRLIFHKNSSKRLSGVEVGIPQQIPDQLEDFIMRFKAGLQPSVTLEDGIWSILPPIYARKCVKTGMVQHFPDALTKGNL
jgi:predicted dehydrogenase